MSVRRLSGLAILVTGKLLSFLDITPKMFFLKVIASIQSLMPTENNGSGQKYFMKLGIEMKIAVSLCLLASASPRINKILTKAGISNFVSLVMEFEKILNVEVFREVSKIDDSRGGSLEKLSSFRKFENIMFSRTTLSLSLRNLRQFLFCLHFFRMC